MLHSHPLLEVYRESYSWSIASNIPINDSTGVDLNFAFDWLKLHVSMCSLYHLRLPNFYSSLHLVQIWSRKSSRSTPNCSLLSIAVWYVSPNRSGGLIIPVYKPFLHRILDILCIDWHARSCNYKPYWTGSSIASFRV